MGSETPQGDQGHLQEESERALYPPQGSWGTLQRYEATYPLRRSQPSPRRIGDPNKGDRSPSVSPSMALGTLTEEMGALTGGLRTPTQGM